ncbi:hypothetical protein R1flu_019743 [Riccia fluitans]|uniref:Uncharacterized protein n=1 Tax=Riccia fluitans TaxID=41844 RepID=A0ABD1ZJI5_9MARC
MEAVGLSLQALPIFSSLCGAPNGAFNVSSGKKASDFPACSVCDGQDVSFKASGRGKFQSLFSPTASSDSHASLGPRGTQKLLLRNSIAANGARNAGSDISSERWKSSSATGGSGTETVEEVSGSAETEIAGRGIEVPPGGCAACGKAEKVGGCNGEGRIQGGIGAVPGFGWWPIKAFRPCPSFVESGGKYKRIGQSLDEVAFGRAASGDDLDISERLKGR